MNELALGVKAAVEAFGTQTALAKALGIERSAISQWKQWGRVPVNRVIEIEKASNGDVLRYELRPDIFGPAPKKRGA